MDEAKYAIICQPLINFSKERYEKAVARLEDEGYVVRDWPDKVVDRIRNELSGAAEVHGSQFLLGVTIMLASVCTAAYFPKDWMDDDFLKDLYLIAFKYGMTLVVEKE